MSVLVRVPGSLRDWLGGVAEAECSGATVGECLRDLETRHPGIAEKVLDTERGVPRLLLFLNGDNVMGLGGLETPVRDGDQLGMIPLAAGG